MQVCLVLNKGKPSREHTYPAIRVALLSLLSAWGSPFALTDVPQGCRIQATACDITGACSLLAPALLHSQGCPAAQIAASSRQPPGAAQRQPNAAPPPTCRLALLHLPSPPPNAAAWLHLPEADRALAAFNARAAGSEPGGRPLAKELFFQEDIQGEVGAVFPVQYAGGCVQAG